MSENKKTLIISIIAVVVFIASIAAVSFAFYTTTTKTETGDNLEHSVITENVETSLTEDNVVQIENMIPGDTFTKTFSVKSSVNLSYHIAISDITNTFTSTGDITYDLKENGVSIGSGTFPTSQTGGEGSVNLNTNLITINGGETKNYTLTVTYKNTAEDQRADMGKKISGKIYLRSATE